MLVAEWGSADGAFACRCFLLVRYLIRRVASDLPETFFVLSVILGRSGPPVVEKEHRGGAPHPRYGCGRQERVVDDFEDCLSDSGFGRTRSGA